MTLQPPQFASLADYQQAVVQPSVWKPLLDVIAEQHGLGVVRVQTEAGVGGTYPTFLMGDVVLKLFGYLPRWREAFTAELDAMRWVGQSTAIPAPRLLAWGELFESEANTWPYLVMNRIPGIAWHEAKLSSSDKLRVAEQLGEQLARLHTLPVTGFPHQPPADAPDITQAAQRSSLPVQLLPQVQAFVERYSQSLGASRQLSFVHGDLMFRHVFVQGSRLVGLIDWGDALVIDPHYELVQMQLNLFDRDARLLRAMLDAAQWQPAGDFSQRCLVIALTFRSRSRFLLPPVRDNSLSVSSSSMG